MWLPTKQESKKKGTQQKLCIKLMVFVLCFLFKIVRKARKLSKRFGHKNVLLEKKYLK